MAVETPNAVTISLSSSTHFDVICIGSPLIPSRIITPSRVLKLILVFYRSTKKHKFQ